jgi:tight adherence protein B
MEPELFPIVLAACVALFAWGAAMLVRDWLHKDQRKLAQRLAGTSGTTGAPTGTAASIVIQDRPEGLPPFLANSAFIKGLYRHLIHAYPDASMAKFLVISAATALVGSMALWLSTDSLFFAIAGLVGGGYVPVMFVLRKKGRRQKVLSEQLPEALEFLQRVLRAGHSLSTGIAMIADEMAPPLSAEFRRCYEQHSLGQSLEEAMRDMARRIESTDFAFFVTAVLIQRQTGGDLSHVLGNISGMIRQRIRLEHYVKAKTAEGRLTGYILVAFPILMFFVASAMNADYRRILLHDSAGLTLLSIAASLVIAGLIAIRRITTMKF